MSRGFPRRPEIAVSWKSYWATIAEGVPAETVLAVMRDSGFVDVDRKVLGEMLSEYVGGKPARS